MHVARNPMRATRWFLLPLWLLSSCGDDSVAPAAITQDSGTEDSVAQHEDSSSLEDASPDAPEVLDGPAEAALDSSGSSSQGEHFYNGPQGSRRYLVHVPGSDAPALMPMVMVLHGCNQDPESIQALTGFNALADQEKFVTVYPHQDKASNPYGCWNWFVPAHQGRDGGEPAILAAIAAEVMAHVAIDPKRVHVAGLSAGGAMAVVMASTWPDLFASVGVVAGCPYKGTPCLNAPSTESVATLAGWVNEAMGVHARVLPMILMQGTADLYVPAENAALLRKQWLGAQDLADDGAANGSVSQSPAKVEQGTSAGGRSFAVETYEWQSASVLESWLIQDMDHAWPGGAAGQPFSDPKGPDATLELARFLAAHPMP